MKMILPIGNNRRPSGRRSDGRGLTLIELLITIVILGSGMTMIYKTFFLSLDTQDYLSRRLLAAQLTESRLVRAQAYFAQQASVPSAGLGRNEQLRWNGRPLNYQFDAGVGEITPFKNFYRIQLNVAWQERGRTYQLSRNGFLNTFKPDKP